MSFFGVEINYQINKLLFDIRLQISRNKYKPNIRTIYQSFACFDPNISGEIPFYNFEKCLNENGIFFKKYEIQAFQKAYGKGQIINWCQFLSHLREPMGPLRRQLVEEIFECMDANKNGKLTIEEIMNHFNTNQIESFKFGKKTKEEVENQFFSLFSIRDGSISKEQFVAFYDDVNINFAHNEVFIRYVSAQWNYTPQKKDQVKQENIRAATKALRFKLIEKSQASKDEFVIKKLFGEFDTNGNFYLGTYELDLMMKKLGVEACPSLIEQIHCRIDKNNSGYIEFEDFKKFLFHDPYPI